MFGLGTPELVVIIVIIVIFFGAGGITQVARTLGQTRRELKQIQDEIQKPVRDVKDALEESLPLTEPPLWVFVSSVMNPQCEDLKPERAAAKKAIEAFPPLTRAWRFEDSPASPEGAGRVYLDKVKQCDIFVLVVGKDVTRPVLKEYATAKRHDKLCLVFLKKGPRDDAAEAFIRKVRSRVKYAEFETDVDLDYQIWRSLAALLIASVRKFKLSASDVAALTLFLNELPKLESSEPRLEISEPESTFQPVKLLAPKNDAHLIHVPRPGPLSRDFAFKWIPFQTNKAEPNLGYRIQISSSDLKTQQFISHNRFLDIGQQCWFGLNILNLKKTGICYFEWNVTIVETTGEFLEPGGAIGKILELSEPSLTWPFYLQYIDPTPRSLKYGGPLFRRRND